MYNASVADAIWFNDLDDIAKAKLKRVFGVSNTVGENLDAAYHRGYLSGMRNTSMIIYAMQAGGKTEHEIVEFLKVVR